MTSTTISEARQAIYTLFYNGWGGATPETPVVYDQTAYDPTGVDEWVRISVRNVSNEQATLGGIGDRKFDRSGNVFVEINVEPSIAQTRIDELIDKAKNVFEGIKIGGTSVFFKNVTHREQGIVDNQWNVVVVDAEYEYNETR